ncbi:MAG: transporter ATP-binding protein [Patescibacteria group bacterium]|jgi:ATP-binding cassette subfamily B protein|nr:transporter ATP-binding protein [Patescibacteria group bacterium]
MENVIKATKIFCRYSWKYPRDVLLASTVIIQALLMAIIMPLLAGFGIGKISNPESISLSFASIIFLMVAASIIAIGINRLSSKALDRFELDAVQDLEKDIASHILNESYEFHSKSFSGALINQANKFVTSYVTFIDTVFMSALRWLIVVFASSITLLFYDVYLGLILLATALLGSLSTILMVRKRYKYQKKATESRTIQNGYFADMVSNAVTIKTFASENYELNAYKKLSNRTALAYRFAWRKQVNANNVILAMVAIMNVSILIYGIYGVQNGFLSTSIFITAQLYAVRLSGSFWDAASMLRTFERLYADAYEMTDILQVKPELNDLSSAKNLEINRGEIKFTNVNFHYSDDHNQNVIDNFNLVISPGEKVGIVGKSGGGKTTLTKLVLRFMDIQDGKITIDGQNISGVTQNSLRKAISYVPQEPLLFHRSIAENIGYGISRAKLEDIIEAAKLAQAHDFIKTLPNQYDTEVGERGVKLSGGQRQRVAIARALLKDSPILVLDEATSALDSESEILIQKALWKLMENRTALVIAHRLSTIQKMDRIIVVDNGRIIEEGTHKQLLAKKGTYASLWKHQSGGFIED